MLFIDKADKALNIKNMRIGIFVLIILVVGCADKKDSGMPKFDQSIVLINAGTENKEKIALMLANLDACKPKVIGVNLLFKSNGERGDTALAASIEQSGKVVLSSVYQDERYFQSDSMFIKSSIGEGLIELGVDEDGLVDKQMVFISVIDDLKWSFPMTVASLYDPETSVQTMHKAQGNSYYEISFDTDDFMVLDASSATLECERVRDKIVLVGYLGPGSDDSYHIVSGEKRYATWILANCVRDILNGHFVKVE